MTDSSTGLGNKRPFVLGIMSVYNERDIIEYTILHMRAQQVPLIVIDNGSTDGSYEILEKYLDHGIAELTTMKTEFFEIGLLLRTLYGMATNYNPEWLLVVHADEILESPFRSMTLKQAIQLESSKGHNLIQFDNFEFWPTEMDKDDSEPDPTKRIRYYSWNDDWQFKCFKNYLGTNVDEAGGHLPIFPPNVKVSLAPEKFILRHYAVRSYAQGMRKVDEMLARYTEHEKRKWGLKKYTKFGREESYFIIDSSRLTRYDEDGFWVVERKFDGHRGYGFPSLRSSVQIENEMERLGRLIASRHQ